MGKEVQIIEAIDEDVLEHIARDIGIRRDILEERIAEALSQALTPKLTGDELSDVRLKKWWIGWEEPKDMQGKRTKQSRSMSWSTGLTGYGARTMCALVWAKNELEAERKVSYSYQGMPEPGQMTWRFVERRQPNWLPGDRFPDAERREREFAKSEGEKARKSKAITNPFPT